MAGEKGSAAVYKHFPQRVRALRKRLHQNQAEFARELKVSQATVSRWESGRQSPDTDAIIRLADLAGEDVVYFVGDDHDFQPERQAIPVPVVGSVFAGQWLESIEWPDEQKFVAYLPVGSHLAGLDLIGFSVLGESMNRIFPPGTLLFAVSAFSHAFEFRSGANVIVQRISKDGLYEATVKEFVISEDGTEWLWPRSTDPEHQTPIRLDKMPDDIESASVVGLVVASLRYEGYEYLHSVDDMSHRQRLIREGVLKRIEGIDD